MQVQNRSSASAAKEKQLADEVADLRTKLEAAEFEKQQIEVQVEALLEYNKQAKNIEV